MIACQSLGYLYRFKTRCSICKWHKYNTSTHCSRVLLWEKLFISEKTIMNLWLFIIVWLLQRLIIVRHWKMKQLSTKLHNTHIRCSSKILLMVQCIKRTIRQDSCLRIASQTISAELYTNIDKYDQPFLLNHNHFLRETFYNHLGFFIPKYRDKYLICWLNELETFC